MIAFTGFPNDDILNEDVKIDFEIVLHKDFQKIFEEKIDTKMEDKQIEGILFAVKTIINNNKKENEEYFLENLIEFLIWFEKKIDYESIIIKQMISEYSKLTEVPNLLKLIINQPEDIKNYNLLFLIDDFMNLDFHLYKDNTFILLLKKICDIYQMNYKNEVLYIISRYLNEKATKEIEDNFDKFDEGYLINIINGNLTEEKIQKELESLNFLMKLVQLNENK